MAQARIYRPSKTSMQAGKAKNRHWILEFCPNDIQFIEPIMGWRGSNDTLHQIRLTFRSLESAMVYADKMNLILNIEPVHSARTLPKQYADNFRYDRVG